MARTSTRKRSAPQSPPPPSRLATPSDGGTQVTDPDVPTGNDTVRPSKKKKASVKDTFEERFDVANRSNEEVLGMILFHYRYF